ncbi:MAG: hypothetical protein SGILL_003786, partial [Bacillariaceae sp.]
PAMLPTEVAFVEGRELVKKKKNRKGNGDDADEEYFKGFIKQDLKGSKHQSHGHDDGDDDDDSNFTPGSSYYDEKSLGGNGDSGSSNNQSSNQDSMGDSTSATGSNIVGGAAAGIDRMLKGKDGMEFISDIRCCLIFCLLIVAATLTIGVFSVTKNEQRDDFYLEKLTCHYFFLLNFQFETVSNQVYDSSNKRIQYVFSELERISLVTTSFISSETEKAEESGQEREIPDSFVTIADVEYIVGSAREIMRADFVAYLPNVRSNETEAWAQYSAANIGWMTESWYVYSTHDEESLQGHAWHAHDEEDDHEDDHDAHEDDHEDDHDAHEDDHRFLFGIDDPSNVNDAINAAAAQAEYGVNHDIWRFQLYDENDSPVSYDSLSCPMWTGDENSMEADDKEAIAAEEAIESGRVLPYYPEVGVDGTTMSPVWTSSPPFDPAYQNLINFNFQSDPTYTYTMQVDDKSLQTTLADVCSPTAPWMDPSVFPAERYAMVSTPVFNEVESQGRYSTKPEIVGHYIAMVPWAFFFSDTLGDGGQYPVTVELSNECDRAFTMQVQNGVGVKWIDATSGFQNTNQQFEDMKLEEPLAPFAYPDGEESFSCASGFTVTIYPSDEMYAGYNTSKPISYAMVVLAVFVVTVLAFIFFDCVQQRRQNHLVATARRQNLLVSALFPKKIQDQLLDELKETDTRKGAKDGNKSGTAHLRSFLEKQRDDREMPQGSTHSWSDMDGPGGAPKKPKPIADLFPDTTIMFADLVGFTAWASQREPAQVFILLENIYREFDLIAKRRRVFKVEVVGDCYVAVCGLPDPRKKHSVVMAKFARDCMDIMAVTVRRLELELGPDTSELQLRVGLHSGPVVAGVLRGDKSRFQLFGDTMNTASRMESTGVPNRIQISQDTAEALTSFGKEDWFEPREDQVAAKGKGFLSTYFLVLQSSDTASCGNSTSGLSSAGSLHSRGSFASSTGSNDRQMVSVDWTVEVLANILKSVVARRKARGIKPSAEHHIQRMENASVAHDGNKIAIDELCGYVTLPDFSDSDFGLDASMVVLPDEVMHELRDYVQSIAELYNMNNPFHNFDHANHVVLSVNKLLSRINTPDLDGGQEETHMHTYGITSSPLTWFSVILSALLHDVDHSGVSNAQLLKEKSPIAYLYRNKSVAEQNSFDIGWDLLMEDQYKNLRNTIYSTTGEFKRFRQLTLNAVLATDVFDKDLKKDRQDRWDKAFQDIDPEDMDEFDMQKLTNMKASIVIEHLIQASDVAHTMQHWHIYRKWNEKLYMEMYKAFKEGRMEKDPTEFWYQGEIGFFDHYVIPLAGKLNVCGVFGVSSAEYLNYAEQNRAEWEKRGERIVKDLNKKALAKFNPNKRGSGAHNKQERRLSGSGAAPVHQKQQRRLSGGGQFAK